MGDELVTDEGVGDLLVLAREPIEGVALVLAGLLELQVGELVLVEVEMLGRGLHLHKGVSQQVFVSEGELGVIGAEHQLAMQFNMENQNQNQYDGCSHLSISVYFKLQYPLAQFKSQKTTPHYTPSCGPPCSISPFLLHRGCRRPIRDCQIHRIKPLGLWGRWVLGRARLSSRRGLVDIMGRIGIIMCRDQNLRAPVTVSQKSLKSPMRLNSGCLKVAGLFFSKKKWPTQANPQPATSTARKLASEAASRNLTSSSSATRVPTTCRRRHITLACWDRQNGQNSSKVSYCLLI